jgi:hypothetical protein
MFQGHEQPLLPWPKIWLFTVCVNMHPEPMREQVSQCGA